MTRTILGALIAAAAASSAGAGAAAPTPAAPPGPTAARPDCTPANYRQLDFWVGSWNVFNTADNVPYGTSRIERIMNGCAIKETYDAPNAPLGHYTGTSYSGYDRKDGHWHQMYVDTNGAVTWYGGGLEGSDMALTAAGRGGSLQHMVYRPQPDGSVRQIGTVSTDQGATWKAGYDYTYRRVINR